MSIMDENNYEEETGVYTLKGKRVTIKLYKETHAKLKIIAGINDISLDNMASEIIKTKINEMNIAKVVEDGLKRLAEPDAFGDVYSEEEAERLDDINFPKKKVTITLDEDIHKKLKIIASAQDKSLESEASYIVWEKINEIDVVKLVADEFGE